MSNSTGASLRGPRPQCWGLMFYEEYVVILLIVLKKSSFLIFVETQEMDGATINGQQIKVNEVSIYFLTNTVTPMFTLKQSGTPPW